ncbi:hypothetical protein COBT_000166 [Conglomerata obtusa]
MTTIMFFLYAYINLSSATNPIRSCDTQVFCIKNLLLGPKLFDDMNMQSFLQQSHDTLLYAMQHDIRQVFNRCKLIFCNNNEYVNDCLLQSFVILQLNLPLKKYTQVITNGGNCTGKYTESMFLHLDYRNRATTMVDRALIFHLTFDLIQFICYIDLFLYHLNNDRVWIVKPNFYHEMYRLLEDKAYISFIYKYLNNNNNIKNMLNFFSKNITEFNLDKKNFIANGYCYVLQSYIIYMFDFVFKRTVKTLFYDRIIDYIKRIQINSKKFKICCNKENICDLQNDSKTNEEIYHSNKDTVCLVDLRNDPYCYIGIYYDLISSIDLVKTYYKKIDKLHIFIDTNMYLHFLQFFNTICISDENFYGQRPEIRSGFLCKQIVRYFLGKIHFIFQHGQIDRDLNDIIRDYVKTKQSKIEITLIHDLKINTYEVHTYFLKLKQQLSVFMIKSDFCLLNDLMVLFHEIYLNSLVYFFNQKYKVLFQLNDILQKIFVRQRHFLVTTTFAILKLKKIKPYHISKHYLQDFLTHS